MLRVRCTGRGPGAGASRASPRVCRAAQRAAIAVAPLAAIALGCDFDTSGLGAGDGALPGQPDGGAGDAGAPGECADGEARVPFVPTNIEPCVQQPENELVFEQSAEIDTDGAVVYPQSSLPRELPGAAVVEQPGRLPDILVVSTESLRIGAGHVVRVRGSRALALVSTGDIEVEPGAKLTASGLTDHTSGGILFRIAGAGASRELCDAEGGLGHDGRPQDYEDTTGGSGGGGGGFGSLGGAGAPVARSGGDPSSGGDVAGGSETRVAPLRGGCAGGDGYNADNDLAAPGISGPPGGALQLVAGGQIDIAGTVTVSGGGGAFGAEHSGGGGGGSGGGVAIEGRDVVIGGAVTANGGGGGEGIRTITSDGACASPELGENGSRDGAGAAEGGDSGCSAAGAGGDGDAGEADSSQDGAEGDSASGPAAPAGGGGGGGGVGRIHIAYCEQLAADAAVISPEPIGEHRVHCYE